MIVGVRTFNGAIRIKTNTGLIFMAAIIRSNRLRKDSHRLVGVRFTLFDRLYIQRSEKLIYIFHDY